jgi:hypothetical protein
MTLHATVENIRKITKWGSILGAVIVSFVILFRIGVVVKDMLFPPPPPPFEVKYGKLPAIPFGQPAVAETFTYTLDTVTGTYPTFPDRLKVYQVINEPPSLLNAEKARRKMLALRFIDGTGKAIPHKQISPIIFQWERTQASVKETMLMNIETGNFNFTSTYLKQPSIPFVNFSEDSAKNAAADFLGALDSFPEDIDQEKTRVQLLGVKNGTFIPATSLSKAQVIRVDMYQSAVDELDIYYPRYPSSSMNFLLKGQNIGPDDVFEANYYYQHIDRTEGSTYPIKTATEAWAELEEGNGFVSNYFGSGKSISITDISLGYYVGEETQNYLMPIIIFQGDGEFYAYVSAVKENWIE